MDNNEKAKQVLDAAQQVADQFRSEGKDNVADRTLNAFKGVPVGSLARFYDIMQKVSAK